MTGNAAPASASAKSAYPAHRAGAVGRVCVMRSASPPPPKKKRISEGRKNGRNEREFDESFMERNYTPAQKGAIRKMFIFLQKILKNSL